MDVTSLSNPNTAFVNASGESGGRRHNFKASGTYELPYQIGSAPISACSRACRSRAPGRSAAATLRQGAVTVNAEPRGSVELDWLPTLDLRAGRFFNSKAAGSS